MVVLDFVDLAADDPERERMYSEHLYCAYDDLSFEELEPRSFSFNSPFGACPDCSGIGTRMEVDPELIVPDEDKSLDEGAIHPWSHGHTKDYFGRLIGALADALGFRTDIPFAGLPQRAKKALLYGHKTQIEVRYRNRYGRERVYTTPFEGAVPFVKRRHSEAESDASRERFEGYMREVPCPTCEGTRLKPIVLAVTIMGKSIAEVSGMSISDCADFLGELKLNARDKKIAERVLKEVNERLRFLVDVGLDYLSLNRAAAELDGIVVDTRRFAEAEARTALIAGWKDEARTAIALELAAAQLLARAATPIMPRFAARLAQALGTTDLSSWPSQVELVAPGTRIGLEEQSYFEALPSDWSLAEGATG